MTDEQINQRIAEACGWTLDLKSAIRIDGHRVEVWGKRPHEALPDYLHDLNAMHEAEKMLTDDQDDDYTEYLEIVAGITWGTSHSYHMKNLRSATARQRAEAFLRTLGKWEDEA
jgi:hypothetical protein